MTMYSFRQTGAAVALALFCAAFAPAPAAAQWEADTGVTIPRRLDTGLTRAEFYLAEGKYTEALNILRYVLHRHPKSADAYTYRGYAYMNLGDTEKALTNLKRALAIEPRHLGANMYMGQYHIETGDLERAYEQLQVIRMVCGKTDCEEIRVLQSSIDAGKDKVIAARKAREEEERRRREESWLPSMPDIKPDDKTQYGYQ